MSNNQDTFISHMARVGLTAKGVVYLILGVIAFMAAFELGGQQASDADRTGVFQTIQDVAGPWLLLVIAAGLACYCIWRFVESLAAKNKGLKLAKRARYFFSGLVYASVVFTAVKMLMHQLNKDGDSNQDAAGWLLSQPLGEWAVGIGALIFAAVGAYQVHYGLSGKYKKHVQGLHLQSTASSVLLRTGTVGYTARGIIWLLIAFLFVRAAFYHSSSEAGDTSKAFRFVEDSTWGSYLLGIIGLGVAAYGVFNFIRARYERF